MYIVISGNIIIGTYKTFTIMYIVISGNTIIGTYKTFKVAHKEATEQQRICNGRFPVYIAKLIIKDGVVIDK